jgi:hypothetical protein
LAIKEDKIKAIEHKSIHFQEIMEKIPIWIIRWGNTLFFFIFLFFLIGLHTIKYPDVIISDVRVMTDNPSIEVQSLSNGNIIHFLKEDKEYVEKGDWVLIRAIKI